MKAADMDTLARRLADVGISILALIVLSPVMLIVALCIVARDGRPVLYVARRVGRHGVEFDLYKFRTMRENRGSSVTIHDDPRVTRLGRILRRTKIDEFPQLINVLLGNMSLVGPRPEDPAYVDRYTAEQRRVLDFKPGITSVAALQYWDEETMLGARDWETAYIDDVMPAKLQLEIEYASRRSLWTDFGVLWRTALFFVHRVFGVK